MASSSFGLGPLLEIGRWNVRRLCLRPLPLSSHRYRQALSRRSAKSFTVVSTRVLHQPSTRSTRPYIPRGGAGLTCPGAVEGYERLPGAMGCGKCAL